MAYVFSAAKDQPYWDKNDLKHYMYGGKPGPGVSSGPRGKHGFHCYSQSLQYLRDLHICSFCIWLISTFIPCQTQILVSFQGVRTHGCQYIYCIYYYNNRSIGPSIIYGCLLASICFHGDLSLIDWPYDFLLWHEGDFHCMHRNRLRFTLNCIEMSAVERFNCTEVFPDRFDVFMYPMDYIIGIPWRDSPWKQGSMY